MNREIKFKLYCKEHGMSQSFEIWEDNITFPKTGFYYPLGLCLDFCKIMQYIDLKDKNSVEIYDGYIVNIGNMHGCIIIWNHALISSLDKMMKLYGNIEVIGNIYENPELIEPDNNKGVIYEN